MEQLMLEIRPSCEHCNKALPPNATDARICSYECTCLAQDPASTAAKDRPIDAAMHAAFAGPLKNIPPEER